MKYTKQQIREVYTAFFAGKDDNEHSEMRRLISDLGTPSDLTTNDFKSALPLTEAASAWLAYGRGDSLNEETLIKLYEFIIFGQTNGSMPTRLHPQTETNPKGAGRRKMGITQRRKTLTFTLNPRLVEELIKIAQQHQGQRMNPNLSKEAERLILRGMGKYIDPYSGELLDIAKVNALMNCQQEQSKEQQQNNSNEYKAQLDSLFSPENDE